MQPSCPGSLKVMRDDFRLMAMRQSNNPPNGKVQSHQQQKGWGRWRAKWRASSPFYLIKKGLCTENHPSRQNSQFYHLLWCFAAVVWKCVKTSHQTLVTKDWLLHHNNIPSHTSLFTTDCIIKNNMTSSLTSLTHVTWLPTTFFCFLTEDQVERLLVWHGWDGWSRNTDSARHPPRTWLQRWILKWAESLELVWTCRRELC